MRTRSTRPRTERVNPNGEPIHSRRVHNGSNAVAAAVDFDPTSLIQGDPEIDFDQVGRLLSDTSKAYRKPGSAELEGVFDTILNTFSPSGELTKSEVKTPRKSNLDDIHPVRITRRIPLSELYSKFVFHNQYGIGHSDGVQYDFLYALAKELESDQVAGLLGAGPKGVQPLILRDGGVPTRAFLIGETEGSKYRLRLLLTRQEMKLPEGRTE